MSKSLRYLYTDSNYEYTLEIIFTNNVKRSLKSLYKRWDLNEELVDGEGLSVTCENERIDFKDITKYALIFDYNKLTDNLISHEVLHTSIFILIDRNIDLAGHDDYYENLAWLNGHLNDLVRQIISREKIQMYKTPIEAKIKKLG